MPMRNHPDDQRTDSLVYHLSVLTQSVTVALATLEHLLETPDSLERTRSLTALLQALERVNTTAIQHCLGKRVGTIDQEQQQIKRRVAHQYAHGEENHTKGD